MIQLTLFDYNQLDTETRIVVKREDKDYDDNMSASGQRFILACKNIQRIHEALKYKRPGFVEWCNSKPGLEKSTAYKMLEVAKKFPENGNILIDSKEALYHLASATDEARQEAITRAESGERITYTTAKEITNGHKNGHTYEQTAPADMQLIDTRPTYAPDEHLDAAIDDEGLPVCLECGQVYEGAGCPDCNTYQSNGIYKPKGELIDKEQYGKFLLDECKIILGDARQMDLSLFPEKYGVIIADPPWPYRVTKGEGTVDEQYEVMTDVDIQQIPVPALACDNSILLLWATWPKLREAMELIDAWGFDYVTGFPWVKTTTGGSLDYGVGYWVRGVSELILIGRRGKVSPPRLHGFMGLLGPNLRHSRKPESLHQYAETLPGPYLELFGRRPKHGWTIFGNDPALAQKVFA